MDKYISGWTSILVEAEVSSSGRADSFLSASNLTRARQAHQITACALYKLQKEAYSHYTEYDEKGLELWNML